MLQNCQITTQLASQLYVPVGTLREHGLIRAGGCHLTMKTNVPAFSLYHIHLSKTNSQAGQKAETIKAIKSLGKY